MNISQGLPRTGTFSTFNALEQLLPGKCHHMMRAYADIENIIFWTKASKGDIKDEDFKETIRQQCKV